MDLIKSLSNLLNKPQTESKKDGPKELCPNCWGREEYGGQFYEAIKNFKVDIYNENSRLGWIQEYANKNLSGIQLAKKDDQLICNNCKITYKPVEEEK